MMEQAKKLQTLLDAQIGKSHIFNIVTAMQSQDKSLDFLGAAGIADPQTSATMRPDTPYFIASVTKMYTAAIVLRLHQEKRMKLDEPISQYLPASLTRGIHIYKGTDYSDQIKVFQLVNQTSGLANSPPRVHRALRIDRLFCVCLSIEVNVPCGNDQSDCCAVQAFSPDDQSNSSRRLTIE
jgi:CubicO group peptidase (beta-lactamase class C family)